jgi:hypothetical protein
MEGDSVELDMLKKPYLKPTAELRRSSAKKFWGKLSLLLSGQVDYLAAPKTLKLGEPLSRFVILNRYS